MGVVCIYPSITVSAHPQGGSVVMRIKLGYAFIALWIIRM